MGSDMSVRASEITLLKTNEKRLIRDSSESRERFKSLEEELHKIRSARAVEDLQRKELEDQLEAEAYFSGLYKTQVRELQEEVDEGRMKNDEKAMEKNELEVKLSNLIMRNLYRFASCCTIMLAGRGWCVSAQERPCKMLICSTRG